MAPHMAQKTDAPIGFYVTIRRGSRTGALLGPYPTHDDAQKNVIRARVTAEDIDSWAGFDAFGVTRVQMKPGASLPVGKLNDRIGLHSKPSAPELQTGRHFLHSRYIDPSEPVAARVPSICRVTRITKTAVYYRVNVANDALGSKSVIDRDKFPGIVQKWLEY